MVEHTREHPRLQERALEGRRYPLPLGTLFVPKRWKSGVRRPLVVHFHGAPWIVETAAERLRTAVIAVQIGAGSSRYAAPFRDDPALFPRMLAEAERSAATRFDPVILSSWSAGYGAIREILRQPANAPRVARLLAIDSIHAGYASGKPGPLESEITPADMEEFAIFAREALAGRRMLVLAHSEIFPGTFASTTETADFLLTRLGLRRKAILRWGPMRTQQLSDTRRGKLRVMGFAGNSAPDHVDLFHALPDLLRQLVPRR